MRLENKVALITGGGTGIGAATARLMVQEGASVAVTGRRLDPLEDVVKSIADSGGQAVALPGDLINPDDCRRIVDETAWITGQMIAVDGGLTSAFL